MKQNFWKKLPKPFFVLAPMADVTDAPFRRVIATYGKPDVMYTEFASADGMCSPGRDKVEMNLWHTEKERPIVAQIFSSNPDNCYQAALRVSELGFDGIDINMGCPVRPIEKQGAGAAMIKDPKRAQRIIRETMRGAGKLPVSVKTRIGYNKNEVETWIPHLLETGLAALIVHGRTRKDMSKVPARWDVIARCVEIAHSFGSSKSRPLIIGNGDVKSVEEGIQKARMYGVDGVMIGRGIFGNPWLFRKDGYVPSIAEKLAAAVEHTKLFEEIFGKEKPFHIMKKHYKAYVSGFDGAKELRVKMMEAKNSKDIERIVRASRLLTNFDKT